MGCHTWFYRKINLPLEDCKKKVVDTLEKYVSWELSDLNKSERESDEEACTSIKNTNRVISWIKKGWITEACYRLLDEVGYYDINTKIYYRTDDHLGHDTFRIGGYPETKLFSLEETLDFLEKNDDKISYASTIWDKTDRSILKAKAIERLKEFWEKNPDGMIDFG